MNKNLGIYAINREKGSYNCSITCEDLEITTKINAVKSCDTKLASFEYNVKRVRFLS